MGSLSWDGVTERLLGGVRELSLARTVDEVAVVVREAARSLTGADGATFVLRDGDECFYVDENAISPLWKGRRFPVSECVSGWAMLNKEAVVIEDIYADDRVPHDVYRPTFVRSLVMVPIRASAPIGSIGNYWATSRQPSPGDVRVLQALADATSVAMENVTVYAELEARVRERTRQLEEANRDLDAFSHSVAHELRTPIGHLLGFSRILIDRAETDPEVREMLGYVHDAGRQLDQLVSDLLRSAQAGRQPPSTVPMSLSSVARDVVANLRARAPSREIDVIIAEGLEVLADPKLVAIVLENLLGNAWKYTARATRPRIELGRTTNRGRDCFFVRDNGAGFDPKSAARLFTPFARLHGANEFVGTGVGLSTTKRIIERHGGEIWADGKVGEGATFFWTLGTPK